MPTTWTEGDNKDNTSRQTDSQTQAAMDFSGKWQVYSDENKEEFLKAMGVPDMVIKMAKDAKPAAVIEQRGDDITVRVETGRGTIVNAFTVGMEADITVIDGRKIKCTTRRENGKLICEAEKFTAIRELQGEDMVESFIAKGSSDSDSVTCVRRSRRV